jgi:hypothetical protein
LVVVSIPTIYFVQVDRPQGPVKIGYTGRRVSVRMAEGQTFSPKDLEVLVEAYGTYEEEAKLHRIFKPYHIRGEWYEPGPLLMELVYHLMLDGGDLRVWLESHN